MNPPEQLDIWQLIFEATPVVKGVMILLVLMSLASWFIIGIKLFRLITAGQQSARFLDLFWSKEHGNIWNAARLEAIYAQARQVQNAPIARVFHAGYVELARVTGAAGESHPPNPRGGPQMPVGDIDNVERALRRASVNELTALETAVPFLATTGSTAPFVGLFGTVWGIMNSFIAIGSQRSASLDVVAPGIAEALIATAIGLAAAIPAVMAYNFFVRRIQVLETEMDAFASDYLNIVRRHFLTN
jgi:biopolymer transport protein TolQ